MPRGLPVRTRDPHAIRQAEGISAFATRAQARRQAKRYPVLGNWLSEVAIDPARAVHVQRTEGRPGHHTIWGDADSLLACVKRVVPA
jgi:hypothetical protein